MNNGPKFLQVCGACSKHDRHDVCNRKQGLEAIARGTFLGNTPEEVAKWCVCQECWGAE